MVESMKREFLQHAKSCFKMKKEMDEGLDITNPPTPPFDITLDRSGVPLLLPTLSVRIAEGKVIKADLVRLAQGYSNAQYRQCSATLWLLLTNMLL